jgi:hypothetical protein
VWVRFVCVGGGLMRRATGDQKEGCSSTLGSSLRMYTCAQGQGGSCETCLELLGCTTMSNM